jgi:signal transduction histidine kinase/CheY-like chemotaxis protein
MPSLIPLAGEPRSFEVGARTVIGRDPTCEVCLEDPSVSRRHAEIRLLEDGRYEVVDLASKHGILVRGEKVQKAVLAHGDELRIGLARFRFQAQDPALSNTELRISVADAPGFRPAALIASESELRRDYDKLRAGIELSRAIGVEHHLPTLLGRILDAAIPLLAADRGAIALLDPGTQEATLQIGRGRGGEDLDVPLSLSLLREVVAAKAGVISADAAVDGRFNGAASLCAEGIRSLMCVPMFYRGTLVGAMQLDSGGLGVFREKDLQLFSMITNQAAVAIHNALLVQKVNAVHAEHRARLERIVRGLPDGVLLLDAEARLVMVNQRAEALLPVLTSARQGDVLARLGDVALPLKGTVEVTAGRRIFALSQVALDSQTLITLREVTEEREEQARAAQQERLALIGQFAGGIAHDFNNVIAVITTNAEFLEESIKDPDQREDARQIREAAERAADLTRRVLSFGRREPCQPRPLDLRKSVLDIEKILRRTLGAHIELSSDLQAAGSLVRADPTQLEQVLLNLAVNARDAMPEGGRLHIATRNVEVAEAEAKRDQIRPGLYVELIVQDTGCGMPPEVAARVFEPFFTTKPKGRGTGLGLATVYGIVKQSGGSISLISAAGAGTSFRLLFPVTEEQAVKAPAQEPVPKGGSETILVVEDERAVRQATRRSLERAGYRVLEAGCKREALAVAKGQIEKIDLLLTDLVMPGGSGKELSDELRAQRSNLPVLFMSGYFDEELASEQLSRSLDFLPKPFTREQLLTRTRHALGVHIG